MRKAIIIILTAFTFYSCSSKDKNLTANLINITSGAGQPLTVFDSAYTVILYSFNWNANDHRITTARRGIRTSYKPNPNDLTKNIFVIDTVYQIPFWRDSLGANKKPVKDSSGNVLKQMYWVPLEPKELLLYDFKKQYK